MHWTSDIKGLLARGRYVDAVFAAGGPAAIEEARRAVASPREALRVARLLRAGANERGANALLIRAHRRWPDDPDLTVHDFMVCLGWRGPIAALDHLRRVGGEPPKDARSPWRARWWTTRANIAGIFRDFDQASVCVERAIAEEPLDPAIRASSAWLDLARDRRDEALRGFRAVLESAPHSAYAWLGQVSTLSLLERRAEAIAKAEEALTLVQEHEIALRAGDLHVEGGDRTAAMRSFEQARALAPLADKHEERALAFRMVECAFLEGRLDEAAALAERAIALLRKSDRRTYAHAVLEAVRDPERRSARRIVLPVPFVAQDHNTCSPATLAAIAGAWTMPDRHDDIAESICDDGTPDALAREWAESRGMVVAHFTPSYESARRLIEAGIPFALHTRWLGGAHAQTVMGIDERTRWAVVREPSFPRFVETDLDELRGRMPSLAHRGLAMVPRGGPHEAALGSLGLADREVLDRLHVIELRLLKGDQRGADAAFAELKAFAPEHDATLLAIADEAARRHDREAELAAVDTLVERYPAEDILLRRKASCLGALGRDSDAVELVRARIGPETAPGLILDLASFLDGMHAPVEETERQIEAAVRRGHDLTECAALAGFVRANHGRTEEAEELLSAALWRTPAHRGVADRWVALAQTAGTLDRLVTEFERRVGRCLEEEGPSGAELMLSLASAQWRAGRTSDAAKTMGDAAARFPDDHELQLLHVRYLLSEGRTGEAKEKLATLEDRGPRPLWLSTKAWLAGATGDRAGEIAACRELLELDPLSPQALRILQGLAFRAGGASDILDEIEALFEPRPWNEPLALLLADARSSEEPAKSIDVLRRHLAVAPWNAAARVRLAWLLRGTGDLAGAIESARAATAAQPHAPTGWMALASLLDLQGGGEEALRAAEKVLDIDPEFEDAYHVALRALGTPAERQAWIHGRWEAAAARRVSDDALGTLLAISRRTIDAAELRTRISACVAGRTRDESVRAFEVFALRILEAKPEALAAAEALARDFPASDHALAQVGAVHLWLERYEDALRVATTRCELRPELGDAWLQRANALRHLKRQAEWADAFERAGILQASSADVAVGVAKELLDAGEAKRAKAVLDASWQGTSEPRVAIARLQHACRGDDVAEAMAAIRDLLANAHGLDGLMSAMPHLLRAMPRSIRRRILPLFEERLVPGPSGARAAWAWPMIDTRRATAAVASLARLASIEARAEAALGLMAVASEVWYGRLAAILLADHAEVLRSTPRGLLETADGLFVLGRRREILPWLQGWQERADMSAAELRQLAYILAAAEDDDGAVEAGRRCAALGDESEMIAVQVALASVLVRRRDWPAARRAFLTMQQPSASDGQRDIGTAGLAYIDLLDGTKQVTRAAVAAASKTWRQLASADGSHAMGDLDRAFLRAVGAVLPWYMRLGSRLELATERLSFALGTRIQRWRRNLAHGVFDLVQPLRRLIGFPGFRIR